MVYPAGLLLDFDGTLVDSEPLWAEAETEVAQANGSNAWTKEHQVAAIGGSILRTASTMKNVCDLKLSAEEIVDQLTQTLGGHYRNGLVPWLAGAKELLHNVQELSIPVVIVSASPTWLVRLAVETLSVELVTDIVGGDQVANPKPHPDSYLRGAAKLGVDPAQTIAIEDSQPGVDAALAAGCITIAIPQEQRIKPSNRLVVLDLLTQVNPQFLAQIYDTYKPTVET